ncbi:MAG TPA: hypothetical protein VHZ95_17365 [Polyangiales bacterium]|nr:hypothetical protein [Polyangiales bacterium]
MPIKQAYASERVTREATPPAYGFQPSGDAERLLSVQVSLGFWSKVAWYATFFSDGTLHADAVGRSPLRRASAKLTAAELQRLTEGMTLLELCRSNVELCTREDVTDDGAVTFQVWKGPLRGNVIEHYQGSNATPPAFLNYETFVLKLISLTLGAH